MSYKTTTLCLIVALIVGASVGYRLAPVKEVRKDIVTTVVVAKKPDGSTETKTVIEDKSTSLLAKQPKKDWLLTAGLGVNDDLNREILAMVQRRIIGEVYAGVWATTDGSVGLGLTIRW